MNAYTICIHNKNTQFVKSTGREYTTLDNINLNQNIEYEKLELQGIQPDLNQLTLLRDALRDSATKLRCIEITSCVFTDETLDLLIEILKFLSLTRLSITGSAFPSNLIDKLSIFLKENLHLQNLQLIDLKLSDQSIKVLLNSLQGNSTLKELDLKDNNIGPIGMGYLYDFLTKHQFLKHMDVAGNPIGTSFVQFAQLPQYNPFLTSINFFHLFSDIDKVPGGPRATVQFISTLNQVLNGHNCCFLESDIISYFQYIKYYLEDQEDIKDYLEKLDDDFLEEPLETEHENLNINNTNIIQHLKDNLSLSEASSESEHEFFEFSNESTEEQEEYYPEEHLNTIPENLNTLPQSELQRIFKIYQELQLKIKQDNLTSISTEINFSITRKSKELFNEGCKTLSPGSLLNLTCSFFYKNLEQRQELYQTYLSRTSETSTYNLSLFSKLPTDVIEKTLQLNSIKEIEWDPSDITPDTEIFTETFEVYIDSDDSSLTYE